MLVVPVPKPASLNEVTSAPVLLMLLVAEMKCGLSASAGPAAAMTATAAVMNTSAIRRIGFPLCQVARNSGREFLERHPFSSCWRPLPADCDRLQGGRGAGHRQGRHGLFSHVRRL